MKIYVVRHGETTWNAVNKVCGITDVDLTEKGKCQAAEVAEMAKEKNIDIILSSPLKRAIATSQYISDACNVPIQIDERLIEQNYGIYEGVDRKDDGFLNNKRHFAYRYPGGESMMQVAYRIYGLLDEIKEKYQDKTVLLVCHGGVCRIIKTYFEDMTNDEFFHYSPSNCNVQEYEY